MRDDYSALTLDHFRQPRNVGVLPAAADVVQTQAGSRAQEAMFLFSARIAAGKVQAVGWQAWGCPHSIAAASLASEWLMAREGDQLMMFDWKKIAQSIDIPESKIGRLLLLEDAIRALAQAVTARRG